MKKTAVRKLLKEHSVSITILILLEIALLLNKIPLINLFLVPLGAIIGHLILEIKWLFPKKEIMNLLPLILLPLTIFILTSTADLFGKSLIIFFNLRLLLDKKAISLNN